MDGFWMRLHFFKQIIAVVTLGLCMVPGVARAVQTPVDQADPSVVEDQLQKDDRAPQRPKPTISIARPRAGSSNIDREIVVGAIRVQGTSSFPPSAFAPVIEPYVGRTLTADDLQALAADVADVARSAGFGLATAWVPEQRIANGVLSVMLDEGRIDDVQIVGNAANVRRVLAPLLGGRPVRTAELERQLLVAGDLAGVRIGKVRLDRRGDKNVLLVEAVRKRIEARAYVDNWGSSTVGPVRARLTVDMNGLLSSDDQLTVGGVLTPLQPKEFALARLSYTTPIGFAGTEVSFGGYYGHSHPGGTLASRDISGRSAEAEVSVRHPFVRTRNSSFWGGLDFRLREAKQSVDDVKARQDRLAIAGANLFAIQQIPNGRLRARLVASRGLNLFDATRKGDPLASRPDAGGIYSKVESWVEYQQDLGGNFSILAQAEGQLADRPLLSSEEMGLGGRSFGRAWDYREFSGDRGVAGSFELRYQFDKLPQPFWSALLYGYADAGKVTNDRDGFGGGSLASAGGGLRIWLRNGLETGVEAAFPLTDGFNPADGKDPRFSFLIGARF